MPGATLSQAEDQSERTLRAGEADLPTPGFGALLRGRYRYRIGRPLGRGAFGSVFLARCLDGDERDGGPPEEVAIKILADAEGAAGDLVRRELSALLALSHDRIPRVYDWSLEGDAPFVALEYFPDGSLRDYMRVAGPADEHQVWRLLGNLLSALDVAHRAALLHLDIKPANVLLDGSGGFVLTDFGVSQASHVSRGLQSFSAGTRGYRAPEQRTGSFDAYDLRTDLWGVGATAWAFAAGVDLARREDLLRSGAGGDGCGLPPLSELRPGIAADLEAVITSLLAVDPARRPGSVAEVRARVGSAVSGSAYDAATFAASRPVRVDEGEIERVVGELMDPLLIDLCRRPAVRGAFVRFEDGEALCEEGEHSYYAFLLLRGAVVVSRDGRPFTRISREGSFLGEVAALTGMPRTASMHAAGPVFAAVLNAAELERLVTANPALGLRVIRSLAHRLAKVPADGLEKRRR